MNCKIRMATGALVLLIFALSSRGQALAPAASPQSNAPTATARKFVVLLAKEDFQGAAQLCDAAMAKAAPPDTLRQIWSGLTNQMGRYEKEISVRVEPIQQYDAVFVTCQFEKEQMAMKVVVDKAGKVAGLFFVPGQVIQYQTPAYAKPGLFQEKNVIVGAGEWELPGTLSLPVGKGPVPAVVLVHGSGPNDRDESVGANKPFRDLAWGLASQGIAVLRYEKRTKQYAAKYAASLAGLTVREETVADAQEAVSLLRKTEGIDPKRVFVLGHSLGGTLVPRIGAGNPGIAGFIIMAGAARPLEDLVLEQTLYQASLAGELSADENRKVEEFKRQVAAIKSLSKESPAKGLLLFAPVSYWLDLQGYNPPAAARTLKQPLLILQGAADCQVNPTADFEEWRKALSDRKDVKFRIYPNLNHLFIEVQGKSTGAEYEQPGHVSESVVRDIAAFIKLP